MEELNGHFKQVIGDAIHDLKSFGIAYVFFQNQVDEVVKIIPEVVVENDDGIYKLTVPPEKKVGDKRGRKKC